MQQLADKNDWMNYIEPDFTSEEGRSIPYVYLSSARGLPQDKLRIWATGGVHGNEPAGDQALLSLLGKMDANETWTDSLLDVADLLIMPRYNPDGVAYFQRYLASSFDPNRDHVKLSRQQTQDIKRLETEFDPHVGIDCHEYTASRAYGRDDEYLPSQDGQFSAMKNLNIHSDIRNLSETLFTWNVAAAMDKHGLRHSPYVITPVPGELTLHEIPTDTKTDVHAALMQGVHILTETRGIQLGDQHFHRRTTAGLVMVEAIMQTVIDNADHIKKTIEDARDDFINGDHQIVVTDYPRPTNITWPFIVSESGDLVDTPIMFGNNTPANANLTRPRPEGYIFSKAWADVAHKLQAVGIQVETLKAPFKGEVEAIKILAADVEDSKFEGVARTTITNSTTTVREVQFPAGAFWVPSRQRLAAHAFVRLEPENKDSFAAFNILPVAAGDEYPVFRVLKK